MQHARRAGEGEARLQILALDEGELRGFREADRAILGQDVVKIFVFAQNADGLVALNREHGGFLVCVGEDEAAVGFNLRKAGDAAFGKLAIARVLFQHITRLRREDRTHLIEQISLGGGGFRKDDQLIRHLDRGGVLQLHMRRILGGLRIEKNCALESNQLERVAV